MLKIKDSVKLEELEKFGFTKKNSNTYILISEKSIMPSEESKIKRKIAMKILIRSRKLIVTNNITCAYDNKIEILYDLIQAGLVEKVEE